MNYKMIFTVIQLIVTVLLTVVVLGQEGKDPGMQSISGSNPSAGDSFFSKHSGGTKEAFMSKITVFLAIVFAISTLALFMLA